MSAHPFDARFGPSAGETRWDGLCGSSLALAIHAAA